MIETTKPQLHPLLKLVFDLGPLALFFFANSRYGIFVATATFMVAVLAALAASYVLTRALPIMPVVTAVVVLVFGWLSLGATNFWAGHLANIFGSFGDFAAKFSSNVANRVTGVAAHRFIAKLRILITAVLFLGAGIGSLRRAADTRTLEALVAVPFLLVVAQNYGGEGLIRVVLFGLPFLSNLT